MQNAHFVAFSFSFQLGWAVCAAQRLRLQHGSISHPQKIPSNYWVLKVCGRSSKKHNHPRSRILVADRIMSLQSSDCSSPKRRGTARFNIGSMGSMGPRRQLHNQSSPSLPAGGHAVTGSTHSQCKPQPTGAQESPRTDSEQPRPKESQSPEQR